VRNDNPCNSLLKVLVGIPNLPRILNWLIFQVLAELNLGEILGIMLSVEFFQPITENVIRMGVWLNGFFVSFLLSLSGWHEIIFHNIVTKSICGLGILSS
jgi:hypothetical protein